MVDLCRGHVNEARAIGIDVQARIRPDLCAAHMADGKPVAEDCKLARKGRQGNE